MGVVSYAPPPLTFNNALFWWFWPSCFMFHVWCPHSTWTNSKQRPFVEWYYEYESTSLQHLWSQSFKDSHLRIAILLRNRKVLAMLIDPTISSHQSRTRLSRMNQRKRSRYRTLDSWPQESRVAPSLIPERPLGCLAALTTMLVSELIQPGQTVSPARLWTLWWLCADLPLGFVSILFQVHCGMMTYSYASTTVCSSSQNLRVSL